MNQKRKRMAGRFVQKNDFSSETFTPIGINQDTNDTEQKNDSLDDNITEPLLNRGDICETESEDILQLTIKSALVKTFSPIDPNQWRKSNFFFRLMLIIKSPVNIILKLTNIPSIDYEIRNHNWNKVTMIINCLIAPLFIVLATKSTKI